jgi:hypothetical protein
MPKPTIGQTGWGTVLNAKLDEMDVDIAASRNGAEAFSNFRNAANGAVLTLDSGQAWHLVHETDAMRMRVESGTLTYAVTTGGAGGYAEVYLEANVSRIGATVVFDSGTTLNGSATLAIWKTEHAVPPTPVPDSALHLVLTPDYVAIQVWDEGVGPDEIGREYFDADLVDDGATEYTIEAWIDGETVNVYVSNGTMLSASDVRVVSHGGRWACWETFELDATTDSRSRFLEVWADSNNQGPRQRLLTPAVSQDLAIAVADDRLVRAIEYSGPGASSVVLGTSPAELNVDLRLPVVFPSTGTIIVEYSVYVVANAAWVLMSAFWDSSLSTQAFGQTLVNGTEVGQITARKVLNNTPGASATLHFAPWRVGGSASINTDSPSGYYASVSWAPVKQ